ncbi:MAG: type VI secretion system baseplate subunit TssE [Planctomycetota bacterium]|nr:type VI secretion system baseplate subunit TssE [Planctomycetota bacterium]
MARPELNSVTPSILDRLMDPESGGTKEQRGYTLEQTIAAVRRDLEYLLNTRKGRIDLPEEFEELQSSVENFGLPDFGSLPTTTRQQHNAVGQMMELAISRFEPRLRNVRVRMVQDGRAGETLALKFQIEARLKIEPFPDVSFETILELTTGIAAIKTIKG